MQKQAAPGAAPGGNLWDLNELWGETRRVRNSTGNFKVPLFAVVSQSSAV